MMDKSERIYVAPKKGYRSHPLFDPEPHSKGPIIFAILILAAVIGFAWLMHR